MTKAEGKAAGKAASHTPGPWEAQYTIVIGPDSEVIADPSCKGARQAPRDTQKANARLIAAAPRMLDLLREFTLLQRGRSDSEIRAAARAILREIEGAPAPDGQGGE